MNPSAANMILNTIVAEAISDICDQLEADKITGKEFNASLQKILQEIIKKHKKVVFNGTIIHLRGMPKPKSAGCPI